MLHDTTAYHKHKKCLKIPKG